MLGSSIVYLTATADAPADARAVVSERLADDPRLDAATLATSEIVTNAVRHGELPGEESIELRMSDVDDGEILIEVFNRAAHPHVAQDFEPTVGEVGGWGLDIVGAVSRSWGVVDDDGRTLVWFVL
jgi:anti-sigma regulatory factor (Ser/Thr protein kinase)